MAKTTAPLLGFSGSGQIGKTQVYASWRGVKYARRYVVPANPQSTAQTQTRGTFSFLQGVWKLLAPNAQAVWTLAAKGRPLTDRNYFTKSNLAALRGTTSVPATNLDGLVGSPGANGGFAATSLTLTDGTGHVIDTTLVAPAIPSGWAVVKQHAWAIKQQQADEATTTVSVYNSDAATPFEATLSMGAAGTYVVTSWFEFTKSDGTTAYGPSLTGEVTIA